MTGRYANTAAMKLNNKIKKINIAKLIATIIMIIAGAVMILPFLWMISASMKFEIDVFNFPIEWIPARIRLVENYRDVWFGQLPFLLYYLNSIKVTVITTALTLIICSMAAFAFAKLKFIGKDKLFLVYIATMIIPDQVTVLPRFLYFKWMGVLNSHLCIILSLMFSVTTIFFLRQFMMSIPEEISDSAKIDGAGYIRTYWNIVLPLTKPAIATLAILKFIWTWNDYQNAMIFVTSPKLYTIQLGVKMFSDKFGGFYSLIMAAAVSAIIPLFIIFFLGQKYVLEGITAGSVKG